MSIPPPLLHSVHPVIFVGLAGCAMSACTLSLPGEMAHPYMIPSLSTPMSQSWECVA